MRVGVRRDFEDEAGVFEPVDFVENDDVSLGEGVEEGFGFGEPPGGGGEVAVEVFRSGEHFGERGFTDATDAGEPYDGALFPGGEDFLMPEGALKHGTVLNK